MRLGGKRQPCVENDMSQRARRDGCRFDAQGYWEASLSRAEDLLLGSGDGCLFLLEGRGAFQLLLLLNPHGVLHTAKTAA